MILSIRFAIAADVPAILALEESSATAAHYSAEQYGAMIEQGLKFAATTVSTGQDKKAGQNRLALIIEENAELTGFLIGRVVGREWEIENVVVAQEKRKQGLGSALVGEFVQIARQRAGSTVYLEVRESNLAARRLYGKLHFVETGRRKRYYRDPAEDAILYALAL